ncbi:MAG: efflux RND transporter periplasmic adaptor subunit [Burkholderiales bacterium]|nr:efflux RND transporter periplasmic adaptor subunit [Burkholderiales bacterium]
MLSVLVLLPAAPAGAHGDEDHGDAPAGTVAGGLARLPDGSVNLPKLAQRRMAILTVPGQPQAHGVTLELNGWAALDPNAGGLVQAPFSGQVAAAPSGLAVAGQRVQKGQVLAYLTPVASAIELGNQQAALAELRANRGLLTQRLQRLLALEGSVPRKEIEAARAELQSLQGRESAIAASLSGRVAIRAGTGGILAGAHALNGQIVNAHEMLFEIVDPQRLLVVAHTIDPSLLERVASARLSAYPSVTLRLQGGSRQMQDGALALNFLAHTAGASLAVGQPLTVLLQLKEQRQGIALPAEALVRNPANEHIVWVKHSAERFVAHPVEYQALDANTIVVSKGLAPGQRVVVAGAALINQIR